MKLNSYSIGPKNPVYSLISQWPLQATSAVTDKTGSFLAVTPNFNHASWFPWSLTHNNIISVRPSSKAHTQTLQLQFCWFSCSYFNQTTTHTQTLSGLWFSFTNHREIVKNTRLSASKWDCVSSLPHRADTVETHGPNPQKLHPLRENLISRLPSCWHRLVSQFQLVGRA